MSGVTYLSSQGIGILVKYHKQLGKIGGRVRIVASSETVASVLTLTGVAKLFFDERPSPPLGDGPTAAYRSLECRGMMLQIFPSPATAGPANLELIGDPARLPRRGYDAGDERIWIAEPGIVAFGLGALGPGFEECLGRFGEFLAVAGVAAYRPTPGQSQPDFEQAAGDYLPAMGRCCTAWHSRPPARSSSASKRPRSRAARVSPSAGLPRPASIKQAAVWWAS